LQDGLIRLGAIGNRPEDSPEQHLHHRLVIYMGCLMSIGGLVWGTLSLSFESILPALVPYGYVVLTVLNLSYFYKSKNFGVVRGAQIFISLLLPFLFQWVLGGFAASGGVMLWALIAILGAHALGSWKGSLFWGLAFIALTVVSGVIDADVARRFTRVANEGVRSAFFVVNISMIATIMFSLISWLLVQRDVLSQQLAASSVRVLRLNESLEETVLVRTAKLAETMTALGHANDRLMPLAKAWEQVWDPIEICDADGLVSFVNPAFNESISVSGTSVTGELSQIIVQNPEILTLLHSGTSSTATRSITHTQTGLTREYQVRFSPVFDEQAGLSRIVIIYRDITERIEHERELMQQDRLASLGTMAAGMAHEINNPLTYIQANLQQMREVLLVLPDNSASDRQDLGILAAECLTGIKRIGEIVSSLLDGARPDHSTVGPVGLKDLVESCLRVVEHELPHKALLELEMPAEPVYVEGNEAKLSQVLINLILNALAAMESARAGSNRLSIRIRHEKDAVLLEVSDTGTGITPDNLNKIFNPFFTTKPVGEGLGLGLAMSHQIVTGMGGTIVAISEVGMGSTFRVSLRAVAPVQPDASGRNDAPPGSAAASRILIIDDLPQIAKVLARILRSHDVTTAHTANEALQQMNDRDFDVILCDIMMPVMTGLELRATIEASHPALAERFIFVTGGIFSEVDQKSAMESGCPIVRKPVDPQELLAAVQLVLAEAGAKRVPKRVPEAGAGRFLRGEGKQG
jgi:PAS domain S-box-containing protein